MKKSKQVVIHYSGGTDSTCVVCLKANEFDKIHLLTYKRSGIYSIRNSQYNIDKLRKIFGLDKFISHIIDVDGIYKFLAYDDYFNNLKKFGIFNLSVCALCKMSMHVRTIIYCLKNDIDMVFDGSNRYAGSGLAMDQMEEFMNIIINLYSKFNISFSAPIYNYLSNDNISWEAIFEQKNKISDIGKDETTGTIVKSFGLFNKNNIKMTKQDKKIQPRCWQCFLPSYILLNYYTRIYGKEIYKDRMVKFIKSKIDKIVKYIIGVV